MEIENYAGRMWVKRIVESCNIIIDENGNLAVENEYFEDFSKIDTEE